MTTLSEVVTMNASHIAKVQTSHMAVVRVQLHLIAGPRQSKWSTIGSLIGPFVANKEH